MFETDFFTYTGSVDAPEEFIKIADLLEQQYFEMIITEDSCRLVYLMNDAAESFISFRNFTVNGQYLPDCEEKITASVDIINGRYILVVRQGQNNTFTVAFDEAVSETYLYNYGATGHFWIKGHELLRVIDYWLGIVREKFNILGPDSCSDEELDIVQLSHFMPLRFYRSVPEKYMNENDYIRESTPQSVSIFKKTASEAGDKKLVRILEKYTDDKCRSTARILSGKNGEKTVDLITEMIQKASSAYPDRSHLSKNTTLAEKAESHAHKMRSEGWKVHILREEPFENAEDDMKFSVYALSRRHSLAGIKYNVQKYSE